MKQVSVIGGGFSGLAAASFAAKNGYKVTVFEKNTCAGGRARFYQEDGFLFDMGPSWYWMPDIFENYFSAFGKSSKDYYELVQLDPGFQIFYDNKEILPVPAKTEDLHELFESIEKGSSKKLKKFLQEAEYKYRVSMQGLIYRPALSWLEYMKPEVLRGMAKCHLFDSVRSYVRSYFKDERLVMLMEFPVLFLGAKPSQIPALYSLMNYAALSLGTWYPMGGMYKIVEGMKQMALSLGVDFKEGCSIESISVSNKKATQLISTKGTFYSDAVIASADYHHVEQNLLEPAYRNYSLEYWNNKVLAPSCLIFYIGANKKIKKLIHHNLFFDTDFEIHSKEIYDKPQWPKNPLFYVCCPSKTDPSVAPEGNENLFLLVPIAPGLQDTEELRENYFNNLIARIEKHCDDDIANHIVYKKSYCIKDFVNDYNSFKGNAYGLANTLKQTAVLKPSIQNKKVKNLFYTGQLTVPGPGVPPAIISGEIVANQVVNYLKNN